MRFRRGDILAYAESASEHTVVFEEYCDSGYSSMDCKIVSTPGALGSRGWVSVKMPAASLRLWYARGRHVLTETLRES